jgi:ribonucleoside-diphosphate reductase alpha chain
MVPKKRAKVLHGKTYRTATGCGKLYVTINSLEDGSPYEVFAKLGKTGSCMNAMCEGVCRMISLALRVGCDKESVAKHLKGIRCPSPNEIDGIKNLSCPDAIGQALEELIKETKKQ